MRTGAASAVGARRHNENDVIRRTGAANAASAVGAKRHNENDVAMTIAGLWRYGDWRHVATGCTAVVFIHSNVVLAATLYDGSRPGLQSASLYDNFRKRGNYVIMTS